MKHTRGLQKAVLGIVLALLLTWQTPVRANSAQTYWRGTTATGALVTGEDCPVIVEREVLTFDLMEFPKNHYESREALRSYTGQVKAEYTFYNPSPYTSEVRLAFPFGEAADYALIRDPETGAVVPPTDLDQYGVLADGEPVQTVVRHTESLYGRAFDPARDTGRLYDGFREDDFYAPELPVTTYVYQASGVDIDVYRAATAAFDLPQDLPHTRVWMENQCGGERLEDSVRLETWVDQSALVFVHVIGEPLAEPISWQFYENGACETEIEGTMTLVRTEQRTFLDLVMEEYDPRMGILDYDWYNAMVDVLEVCAWSDGVLAGAEIPKNLSGDLMRWYDYTLVLEPGQRLTNTVTAPMYPALDGSYEPMVCTYTYLLSPAQSWAEFGPLDIEIRTPFYLTQSSPSGFTRTETGYVAHFDGLPEGELVFSLSAGEHPQSAQDGGRMWIIGLELALALGVMIWYLRYTHRKKAK